MKRVKIRLQNYNYSQQGLYFITICCQKKACLFGKIKNNQMHRNDAGHMIKKWYYELENKFSNIKCNDMIIMPNHFHSVIELKDRSNNSPLPEIIQWFKTMTTNDYIKNVKTNDWLRFDKQLWQRSFYDHIIRNSKSHSKIVEYIKYNPSKWSEDKYYNMES